MINLTLDEMISKTNLRERGFRLMMDHLKTIKKPLIIETGCARPIDIVPWGNIDIFFKDDGISTAIFDKFINDFDGLFYSVDLNKQHVEYARSLVSSKSTIIHSDSVYFLWELNKFLTSENLYVDLLYLDSFDFDSENPYPSMVHHIKEISVILSRLKPGSLIAVDDNFTDGRERFGKPKYVAELFESLRIPLIHEGVQLIWKL